MKAENTTKTVCKVFFAWQDEKEEKWLEEMAAKGWFLDKVSPYLYSFTKGTPKRIVYRLDYKNSFDKDYSDYQNLYKDSNWELVGVFSNWHYYKTSSENQISPEIFNSDRSKAQKYRRLLYFVLPLGLLIVSPIAHLLDRDASTGFDPLMLLLKGFYLLAVLLYLYSLIRVLIKIKVLETRE
jgi:hypothetical protein